jgi:hypothetical protein
LYSEIILVATQEVWIESGVRKSIFLDYERLHKIQKWHEAYEKTRKMEEINERKILESNMKKTLHSMTTSAECFVMQV